MFNFSFNRQQGASCSTTAARLKSYLSVAKCIDRHWLYALGPFRYFSRIHTASIDCFSLRDRFDKSGRRVPFSNTVT